MPNVEFKIDGLAKITNKLKAEKIRDNIGRALYQWAEKVMAESKEIVPVKTGALMNTGTVGFPVVEADGTVSITLGYGSESVDYALYVHEELQSPSGNPINWTRPGSGPKYLERPVLAHADEIPELIAKAVKEALK